MDEKDFVWGWEGRLLVREMGEDHASSLAYNKRRDLDELLGETNEGWISGMEKRVRRKQPQV